MTFKRTLLAGIFAFALILGAVPVSAQSVPTMGESGWILPERAPKPVNTAAIPSEGAQYTTGSYESQIVEACNYHGCDPNWLINVMYCESDGDHSAVGPNGERGILQYHPQGMWPSMAWASPSEQIWHAAEQFANGMSHHWVCA